MGSRERPSRGPGRSPGLVWSWGFQMSSGGRILLVLTMLASPACVAQQGDESVGEGGWLRGTSSQKFEVIAAQLRGFDVAMVETGHRYQELVAAGRAENWDYAAYQAGKIRTAIESGLQRRPKRAESAQSFLTIVLPALEEAVAERDRALFDRRLGALTSACNACHEAEQVSFVRVAPPEPGFSFAGPAVAPPPDPAGPADGRRRP